jgi:thiol-disulfide isomerase/thioredoxin
VKQVPLWLVMTAAAVLLACSHPSIAPEPAPPKGVPALDEAGFHKVLEQYRGRVLLVNFWATWCEPCREEFPGIVRLYRVYHSRGLSVVAISMDEPHSVNAIQQFLKSQHAAFGCYRQEFHNFPALVDSIDPSWGGGIPASFLYDRQGKRVSSWEGATTYDQLERAVRPLLPEGSQRRETRDPLARESAESPRGG